MYPLSTIGATPMHPLSGGIGAQNRGHSTPSSVCLLASGWLARDLGGWARLLQRSDGGLDWYKYSYIYPGDGARKIHISNEGCAPRGGTTRGYNQGVQRGRIDLSTCLVT